MDKKVIKFDDTEIEEYEFHQYKRHISINDIDTNKIIVSNKFPSGKQDYKYFIGCKDSEQIRLWCIFYPQMTIYIKNLMKIDKFIFNKRNFRKSQQYCQKQI